MVVRRSVPPRPSRPSSSPDSGSSGRVQVPNHNTDPIWSLQPWPATLTVGRFDFDVPALTAADWLSYLMLKVPDLDSLLSEILPEVEDWIFEEDVDLNDVYDAVFELLSTVSARHWWIALRLISSARSSWHIIGPDLMKRGVDATKVSLAAWLDAVLVSIITNMDPKDVTMWVMKLESVPETAGDQAAEMEMSRDSFLSLAD